MKPILIAIRDLLKDRLSLREDSAHDMEIIESISRSVEFRGSNLWALIFAILVAAIGLNVNSTAVVIGAMLISPLMGPIMGIGLGIGINDIDLIRKALKSFLIAVIISIVVSALYFYITPLHDAQSELLARTNPTIWDVFIAFFGGLAGIVGSTRREKGNVIPGVAIATALMPPLCTAGYGLAVGNFYYLLGAIYLFFINSVFICLSSYLVVRYMKLPKKAFEDPEREKKVIRYILTVVIITVLPSIYLAYNIVNKSIFESNANIFLKNEFNFEKTHIINKSFNYDGGEKEISLLIIGEDLPEHVEEGLRKSMKQYGIEGTKLNISQGVKSKEIDFSQIKKNILEEVITRQEEQLRAAQEEERLKAKSKLELEIPNLDNELNALYPDLESYGIANAVINNFDTASTKDTIVLFVGNFAGDFDNEDREKLQSWLRERVSADTVAMFITNSKKTKKRR